MRYTKGTNAALCASALCGVLLFFFIDFAHPDSVTTWRASTIGASCFSFFAPLALLVWSLVAGSSRRFRFLLWARRIILLHFVATALLFAAEYFNLIRPIFYAVGDGFVLFLVGFMDLMLLALAPRASSDADTIRNYRNGMLTLAGGTVVALLAWSIVNIGLVLWMAGAIAEGHPYCIEVEKGYLGGYKPARSLFDLSGLKMQTPVSNGGGSTDYQISFHALLVVDTHNNNLSFWNWSYRQMHFVPVAPNVRTSMYLDRNIGCTPRADFARQLAIFAAD